MAALLCIVLVAASATAAGAAAPGGTGAESFYEDALIRYDQGDLRGALIQLRNVLQRDPANLPARVLRGRILIDVGNAPEAERQIRLARQAGADDELTIVPLARAYLMQRRYDTVISEIIPGRRSRKVEADIHIVRGHAYLETRKLDEAKAEFEESARLRPEYAQPIVGLARVDIARRELDDALANLTKAAKLNDTNSEIPYLTGEVRRMRGEIDASVAAYSRAIAITEAHLPARLARAALLTDLGRYGEALADIDYVRRSSPDSVRAHYIRSVILARKGDRAAAKRALDDAMDVVRVLDTNRVMNDTHALLVSGVVNYAHGEYGEAERFFRRYLELDSRNPGVRRMLGEILLNRKDYNEALRILEPALRDAPDNAALLTALGRAYLGIRRFGLATELFERVVDLGRDTPGIRTQLALSQLGRGRGDLAVDVLEPALTMGTGARKAASLLGLIHLRSGDNDAALEAAKTLAREQPDNPFADNLAGLAHSAKGNLKAARASFLRALAKDQRYYPALYNLAKLDIDEGKLADAAGRYLAVLKERPTDVSAMLELSKLAERRGRLQEAVKWLEDIRKIDHDSLAARKRLVEINLKSKNVTTALQVARELEQDYPSNFDVLELKAIAEFEAGDRTRALATMRTISNLVTEQPARLVRVARLQIGARDFDGARWSLQTATRLDPDLLTAYRDLARLELRTGNVEAAKTIAQRLQGTHPKNGIGDELMGEALLADHHPAEAVVALTRALKRDPKRGDLMLRLYSARRSAGQADAASRLIEDWIARHPKDTRALLMLAQARKPDDPGRAIALYEQVLALEPDNIVATNNLANLLMRQGRPEDARMRVDQAYRLAPESPAVLDSYGWILVQSGNPAEGLRYLREAFARASQVPTIRYHIAAALAAMDRGREACQELDLALTGRAKFAERGQAEALAGRLNRQGDCPAGR